MLKKHRKLLIVLPFVLILSVVAVLFSHNLFKTLPLSLAISSHTDKAPAMVAHRGLSSLYPENSLPAFEGALEHGFYGYELDIHTTKDGEWVVIHDDTVDAMTDGSGDIESYTFDELQKFTLDGGNGIENYPGMKIPTLEESLKYAAENDIVPFIEIKKCDAELLPSLKQMLDEMKLSEKAVLISFDREYLEIYRQLDDKAQIMLLKGTPEKADVDWCVKYNAGLDFGQHSFYKTGSVMKYAKEKGVELGAWTVDNTAILDFLVFFYDVKFITTNKILP